MTRPGGRPTWRPSSEAQALMQSSSHSQACLPQAGEHSALRLVQVSVQSHPLLRSPSTASPLTRPSPCSLSLSTSNDLPNPSGIGHLAQRSLHPLGPSHTHLICSSGGNAGLACAHAALALGTKCTIFVPVTAPDRVIAKLRVMGAEVVQGGAHWAEADAAAREAVASVEGGSVVRSGSKAQVAGTTRN